MASRVYTLFMDDFAKGGIDLEGDDLRVLLVTSTYVFDPDHEFVSDITNEIAGVTNYARAALNGETVSEDLVDDKVVLTADDVVWNSLGNGSNATIAAVVLYKHDGGGDGASQLIAFIELTPVTTDGSDFTVVWNADGILVLL